MREFANNIINGTERNNIMTVIQGDFPNNKEADHAKDELFQIGILATHIRVWNVFPDKEITGQVDRRVTGALLGGAIGGGTGFALGAVVGASLDGDDESHLPPPSGVRIVVDVNGNGEQIQASLRSSGAANIHMSSSTK